MAEGWLIMIWDQIVAFLSEPTTWSGPTSIWVRLWEHLWISVVATVIAVVVFAPLALWLGHGRKGADAASAVVNIGRAVPSFGILAISVLLMVQLGVGVLTPWPVLIALIALAAPPVFTNTVAGIQGVAASTVEAARGMGLTEGEVVREVEVPLASPVIMEGIRIAFVQVIATATLGALTAWGGLGRFIIDGFAKQDQGELVVGAVLVALLAVVAELGLTLAQRRVTPQGLRITS